jgi:nicotinamide riboside kinase
LSRARTLAIVGAECSGKSSLAAALGEALPAVVVPEYLRSFVDTHGRAPMAHEQRGVMEAQIAAERAAAASGTSPEGWIVSDAGALVTAVYSVLYFDDEALLEAALDHHRTAYLLTVWCDIDLPWVEDGMQRDGEEHRGRGHEILASVLARGTLDVLPVSGPVPQRLAAVQRRLSELAC